MYAKFSENQRVHIRGYEMLVIRETLRTYWMIPRVISENECLVYYRVITDTLLKTV